MLQEILCWIVPYGLIGLAGIVALDWSVSREWEKAKHPEIVVMNSE